MKRDDLLTIGGVTLGAVGAFLLGRMTVAARTKGELDERKDQLLEENPDMSEDDALMESAVELIDEGLEAVRGAPEEAGVPEATEAVKSAEEAAGKAEETALLNPEDQAAQEAAAEAERVAQEARGKEIETTKLSLEAQQAKVQELLVAAQTAVRIYDKYRAKVDYWQDKIDDAKDDIQRWNTFRNQMYAKYLETGSSVYGNLVRTYNTKIQQLLADIKYYQSEQQKAINQVALYSHPASTAVSKADNAVDILLFRIEDARKFEVLLTLAARVDRIASSTRATLAELWTHIE